ncbi:GATA transcription factor 21-like [Cucurbita moschata]|uniref:GATA transcription factor 21-like n=1 Tax=Cucurbita moschata TaxID=3662 RepID=A0A6J1ELP1_CUCMO|nr:GATA transcription factor 21-like [Cucurbita moschata]
MAPPYRDSFPSNHDDLLRYSSSSDRHLFFPTTPLDSSPSSPLSFPLFPDLHRSNPDHPHSLGFHHQEDDQVHESNQEVETGLSFTIWKSETSSNDHNHNDSVKWSSSSSSSSSKIRLVINYNQTETPTKTIDAHRNFQDLNPMSPSPSPSPSDQTNKRNTLNDGGGAIIRTCSDCNTTKTPLWRSGPRGPKSLCNACGIRQRKARRAMAEAANGGNSTAVVLKTNKAIIKPAATMKRKHKEVVAATTTTAAAAAASAAGGGGRRKLCVEDVKMGRRLSEISSTYQRVFPQDEREAAILLMTLSYGLLHG